MADLNQDRKPFDPLNFLEAIGEEPVACKYKFPPEKCRIPVVGKKERESVINQRKSLVEQNPYSPSFKQQMKDYFYRHLCKRWHASEFNTMGEESQHLHQYIDNLIQDLRDIFHEDCIRRYPIPGSFSDVSNELSYEELVKADVPPSYVARFLTAPNGSDITPLKSHSPSRVCSMYNDVIKVLSLKEQKRASIYICTGKPPELAHLWDRGIVKIGFSGDAIVRTGNLQAKCGLEISLHKDWKTDFAKRLESLIHAELQIRGLQRIYFCNRCRTKHKEWFELDLLSAKNIVQYWIDWLTDYEPYASGTGFSSHIHVLLAAESPTTFLNNSLGVPWHRSVSNPEQEYEHCTCTNVKNCKRFPYTGEPKTPDAGRRAEQTSSSSRSSRSRSSTKKNTPASPASSRREEQETPSKIKSAKNNLIRKRKGTPERLFKIHFGSSVSKPIDIASANDSVESITMMEGFALPAPEIEVDGYASQESWQTCPDGSDLYCVDPRSSIHPEPPLQAYATEIVQQIRSVTPTSDLPIERIQLFDSASTSSVDMSEHCQESTHISPLGQGHRSQRNDETLSTSLSYGDSLHPNDGFNCRA